MSLVVPIHRRAVHAADGRRRPLPSGATRPTIGDAFDLHPYGVHGKVLATPGHTPGSISILLDSGEAKIIRENKGKHFEPAMVEVFEKIPPAECETIRRRYKEMDQRPW